MTDLRVCSDDQVVETTVEIAEKVGVTDIVSRIVEDLKDESEPYRRMVMETTEKCIQNQVSVDDSTHSQVPLLYAEWCHFQRI